MIPCSYLSKTRTGSIMKAGHPPQGSTRTKRRRVTQACDFCHSRSIRCRPSDASQTCQNCRDFGHQCTYHREPRRRGVQPRTVSGATNTRSGSSGNYGIDDPISASNVISPTSTPNAATQHAQEHSQFPSRNKHWTAPKVASQAVIVDLIDLYFEIVYPIFPLFHQPSFTRRISRAEYNHDTALFSVVMAVCALVSRRVKDGAVSSPQWDLSSLQTVDTDTFIAQSKAQLIRYEANAELNTLRAHAILAIASIQNGNIKDMHFHLGIYHTLVAMDMLHDESNWPKGIGAIEREERRRLFWSIYTLDIYTSVVWGGIIRCRERQSRVAYPMEIEDELLNDSTSDEQSLDQHAFSPSTSRRSAGISADCWLSGWNFITDLYRVLEHALARFHGHKTHNNENSLLQNIFSDESSISEASVADSVLQLYFNLPDCFKETPDMTFNTKRDRYAFQAANITATLQLARIVLLAAGGETIAARCQIAREVLDAFASIPVTYLLAISTPLLHHLGGIGAILGSVLDESCTESEYRMVQSIMLSMAQLLENLEPIHQSSSASQSLRDKASQIGALVESRRDPNLDADDATNAEHSGGFMWSANNQPEDSSTQSQFNATEDLSEHAHSDFLDQLAWNFDFGQPWN